VSGFFFSRMPTSARWLIDRVLRLDATEASHVPTADRVARLFHQTGQGTSTASESDSEEEEEDAQDALEEIDFADLAQIRAEVDAIARGTATTTLDRNAHDDEEDLEEVDFADLAAIRAKVDAAEPQAPSRDAIIQEAFTGVYNQVKNTTQVSITTEVVQQTTSSSASPTLDDSRHLKPVSNLSHHDSFMHDRDTIEEEVPCSSNTLPNMPVEEPSLSTTSKTHPLHPDVPSHDDPHPLFVVDTAPMRPFSGRSASDDILVDRTGHGETLGDQDDEQIVYVAPYPRLGSASPISTVPRVKLPRSSVLTGRSVEVGGLTSLREDDDGATVPDRDRDRMRAGLEGEAHQLSLASLTLGPSTVTASTSTSLPQPTRPPGTNAEVKARKKKARLHRQRQRHNKRCGLGFDAHGVMSEARMKAEDAREKQRSRWESRRRGDSDVDWGTGDEGQDAVEDAVDVVSDGLGGMEIDPDLEIGVDAMLGFLKSMSTEGSQFVTMDDIEDEARMQREDEESQGGPDGSSDSERSDDVDKDEEEEAVFNVEEKILIAESEGDEELSEDSDDEDDEMSPKSGFQARLNRLREQSRGRRPKTAPETSDDEDTPEVLPWTRSAEDEEFIAHITVSRDLTVIERVSHAEMG
jgi:hypothetical protein